MKTLLDIMSRQTAVMNEEQGLNQITDHALDSEAGIIVVALEFYTRMLEDAGSPMDLQLKAHEILNTWRQKV